MRRDEFPIIDTYVKKEINAVLADIKAEIAEVLDYRNDLFNDIMAIIDSHVAKAEGSDT